MPATDQNTMRASIVAGVAVLLSGCLEIEETVTIGADGSGTQHVKMKISRAMLATLQKKAVAARAQDATPVDVTAIFKKKQAAAEFAAAGLVLRRHEVLEKRSSQTLDVEVAFDDLQELAGSPLGGGRSDWILKAGGKGRTALFFYPMGKNAWKEAQVRIKAFDAQPTAARMRAFFRKSKAAMQGLHVSITINLPGRVLRKSPTLRIGSKPNQVVATVRAADIKTPADLLAVLAPCYFVEFDNRNCSFGPNPGRRKAAARGR